MGDRAGTVGRFERARRETFAQRRSPESRDEWVIGPDGVVHGGSAGACPQRLRVVLCGAGAVDDRRDGSSARLTAETLNDAVDPSWRETPMTVHIVAFGAGVFGRRTLDVLPERWSVALWTDGADLAGTAMIDRVLQSRVAAVAVYPCGLGDAPPNSRAMNVMRDLVALRDSRGQASPTVTCRISRSNGSAFEARQWVRQVAADGFETFESEVERARVFDGVDHGA